MYAGRHWARHYTGQAKKPVDADGKFSESLRGQGYTEEAIATAVAELRKRDSDAGEDGDVFWLLPENKLAWEFFSFCDRQWRYGAMGGVMGLDFATIFALMPAFKIRDQRRMLEDLKAIETGALPVLNATDKKRGK